MADILTNGGIDKTSTTNYVNFDEMNSCPCDLIKKYCDPNCCCDIECQKADIEYWDLK